jgi:hypothetical protein
MDLDQAKLFGSSSSWARIGMLVCFAAAAGILMVSIWLPATAKAFGLESPTLQRSI